MENVDPVNIPLPDDGFIPPRDIKLLPFWQACPAAWFDFLGRVASGCATSWMRQRSSTKCFPLFLRTWSGCWRLSPSPTTRSGTCCRRQGRMEAAAAQPHHPLARWSTSKTSCQRGVSDRHGCQLLHLPFLFKSCTKGANSLRSCWQTHSLLGREVHLLAV
jgi:hypothetical protein